MSIGYTLLLTYWPILLLAAALVAACWLLIKIIQKRKREEPDYENMLRFPDLNAFTDKVFPKNVSKHKSQLDLTTLMEEEGDIIIETKQQLQEFYDSHILISSFFTKVVGVSYSNDDGSSRQEILSNCLIGESVVLYWHEFRGEPACAVISNHGQIGYLKAELAADLHEQYVADAGNDFIFSARISDITCGENGLFFGCNLLVSIYETVE